MNEIKKFIKPYYKTLFRIFLILIGIMIVFTIIIFFMNPQEIEIKNSNRRKIDEKINKMDRDLENNFFKKQTKNLRNIRNNTTKKIVENGIIGQKNKQINKNNIDSKDSKE